MKLTFLVLAAGSILISASLLYLLWVARARCGEFERLMGLLHAEYRSGAVRNDYAAFFHSLIPHYLNRRLQQAGWQLRPRYIMAPLFAGFVVVGFATISSGPAGGGMAALALRRTIRTAWARRTRRSGRRRRPTRTSPRTRPAPIRPRTRRARTLPRTRPAPTISARRRPPITRRRTTR